MLLGGVGVGQQPGAGSSAGPARGDELSGPRRGAGGEAAAGRGAARRGRAAGGAVRGAAPERARPGKERAPGWASRRVPQPPAAAPQPLAEPWRLTVSALVLWKPRVGGRRDQGWEVLLFATPVFMSGFRDQWLGSPFAPDGPLLLCPSPFATRQDFRGSGGLGSQPRRDVAEECAPRRDGGDAAMRWGRRACHRSPLGALPSGPEPVFGESCHQGATGSWSCEFNVRLEFWVGFTGLSSGDKGTRTAGRPCGPTRAMFPAGG